MQVVILAGWLGTRLSEETSLRPKPMVEIGGKPIIWHIMKIYASYWYTDFIVCLWYKGYMIKEWFANYFLHNSDVTIDIGKNELKVLNKKWENWKVTLIDTWEETMTGWRIKRIIDGWFIDGDTFLMTYWDGLSDVNIGELLNFHIKNNKLVTLTAVQPEGRFWKLAISWNQVYEFAEKKDNESAYMNWWFMVLDKKVTNYIKWDNISFENEPLENIAKDWELVAYKHNWFWRAMDTLKNKQDLETLWTKKEASWKNW